MHWVVFVAFVITMAVLFIKACPDQTLALVAELKRQLRLATMERSGKQATQELRRRFRQRALAAGYDPELIEQVFKEHEEVVIERLGRKAADQILEEPTPLERYH